MTADVDRARLVRLVAQHARTAQALGVDAVPIRRWPAMAASGIIETKPRDASSAFRQTEVVMRPSVASPKPKAEAIATPNIHADRSAKRPAVAARLEALRERYEHEAPHKNFVTAHTKIVFGDGDPCARLLFVGEAPGAEEDKVGRPFVGRSGQLLDKMIEAMGLSRSEVYICNVLKTRPPDNATPTTEETRLCAPYLYEQIAIVDPEVIVTLGLPAVRALLETQQSMGSLRGAWHRFITPNMGGGAGREIPVMPTYHPAFVLRQYTAEVRAKVWSDLQLVMKKLGLQPAKNEPASPE
jgi:uracil-DNA glycosylase